MFREMRRKDRAIEKHEAITILEKEEYGVISTIGENNYPYGLPLSYVYYDNNIYFHCALEGHKLDNIKYNEKVSFCVVGKTEVLSEEFSTKYESVIVFGKCIEVIENEKFEALSKLIDKYSPEFKNKGIEYIKRALNKTKVYKINIENISGKSRK